MYHPVGSQMASLDNPSDQDLLFPFCAILRLCYRDRWYFTLAYLDEKSEMQIAYNSIKPDPPYSRQ
jgi:hypothetical protein